MTPDISLPGLSDPKTFGESSFDNALPWSQVKAANFKPWEDMKALLPQLQRMHDTRVRNDPEFQDFVKDVADLKAQREKPYISLNEAERRKELTAEENRLKSRGKFNDGVEMVKDDGLQSDERSLNADMAIDKARKSAKDILRNEAASIVADLAGLQPGMPNTAAQ